MKKLFTLCAVATMALTTSAQQTDVSKGSMYLGITNAMDIMDEEVDMSFTVGYAVQDGLIVMISRSQDSFTVPAVEAVEGVEAADAVLGDDPSTEDIVEEDFVITPAVEAVEAVEGADAYDQEYEDATLNLHIRYFKNGYYGQLNLNDFNDATGTDPDMTLSVGAMYNLGAIDGMYIDPNMTLGRDDNDDVDMSFNLGLGLRF